MIPWLCAGQEVTSGTRAFTPALASEPFRSVADIIPEPEQGIVRVRILGTASKAASAGLLGQLNQTRRVYPGTELRMAYELPENGCMVSQTM